MRPSRSLAVTAIALASTLGLAACATPSATPSSGSQTIAVVATTDVWGDIAAKIGGDSVSVTSIIHDPSQDPHSFEADARVQLSLTQANVVIENGGGYDDWADTLLSAAQNPDAAVLNVADISGYDQNPPTGDFNEHLWYDFPAVAKLTDRLVQEFSTLRPESAQSFTDNANSFTASLTAFGKREAALAAAHSGQKVAITEPVPGYLLAASGFTNVTPPAFSHAIENGTDVPPAVLQQTLDLFTSGQATILFYNEQTTGMETEKVLAAAGAANVPTIAVRETLPDGSDYLAWMSDTLTKVESAVG